MQVGIVLVEQGGAIVSAEHRSDGAVVVRIERLPFSLEAVADRAEELAATPRSECVVDAEGLGSALWATRPRKGEWRLYSEHGLERQCLVDGLVVAIHRGLLHFAPGLEHQEAMSKALVGFRRQVREDGLIGSELVIALCLAVVRRPKLGGMAFVA
jgi:hypothetical protein